MRQHWMLPIVLFAPHALSQAPQVVVADILHFQSSQAGPFQPLVRMGFGTPPQLITGIFDTGSSDTIAPQAGSAVCKLQNQQCRDSKIQNLGDFDLAKSSDVQQVANARFNATFSGGDGFDGPYVKTTVSLGDKKVEGAQVAMAVNGSLPGDFPQFPIFGVGPGESEQTDSKYVNLVARMKEAGVIKSNVMGIVLNPTPFANGSVVFGGVDKAKFKGELQEVAIDPANNGKIADFVVKMTSIRLSMNGQRPQQQQGQQRQQGQQKQQGQQGQRNRRSYTRAIPRGLRLDGRHNGNGNGNDNGNGNGNGNGNRNGGGSNRNGNSNGNGNGGGNNQNGNGNRNGNGNNRGNKNGNSRNGNNSNKVSNNGTINLGLKPAETFTLIDTGGVGVQLPGDSVRNLARALGTTFSDQDGMGLVDCAVASDKNNKLLFGFNQDKVTLSMPLSHAVVSKDILSPEDQRSGKCALAISAVQQGSNLNSMGFPWGSAVYTVYDLDKNRLLFAEAVQNATTSDIQQFP